MGHLPAAAHSPGNVTRGEDSMLPVSSLLFSCVVYGSSGPFSHLYSSSVTSLLFNVEQRCTNGSLIYANVAVNAAPLSVFVYLK